MKTTVLMRDTETLTLRRALLLYENGEEKYGAALATINEIVPSGDALQIGPGQLLDRPTLLNLMRKMQGLPQKRAILPERVLFSDAGRLCWWTPSVRRPIWFDKRAGDAFVVAMNGREVLHPPLLFIAGPGHLYVWALGENARPCAESRVYRAPYYNVYSNGAMCRGNVRLPDAPDAADLPIWEQGFFDTQFTHSNYQAVAPAGGGVCQHPRGHDALWRSLVWRQAGRAFPTRYLLPLMQTQGQKPTAEWLTVADVLNPREADYA